MNKNLLLYLIKHHMLQSFKGAVIGTAIFALVVICTLWKLQDFQLTFNQLHLSFVLLILPLWIMFVFAIGACFAFGFYWSIVHSGFTTKHFVRLFAWVMGTAWLMFSLIFIAPALKIVWPDIFTEKQVWLILFFATSFLLIGMGVGNHFGLRLRQMLIKENEAHPDLFLSKWVKIDIKTQVKIFLSGSLAALLSALMANIVWGFVLGYLVIESGSRLDSMEDTVFTTGLSLTRLGFIFSWLPAMIGGYALAYLIYQDVAHFIATKKSALAYGTLIGGLVAFGVSTLGSYFFYYSGPVGTSPAIIFATFLALLTGGLVGLFLFLLMRPKPLGL